MADINEWSLVYPGISPFTFGTLISDYPFSTQVDISSPDIVDQDAEHPTSDGLVMGIDKLGGLGLTFDCKIVPEYWRNLAGAAKWIRPLDLYGEFASKWRADVIRRVPGSYATLTNVTRSRSVFGRPRRVAPTYDRIRDGSVSWLADFKSVDPNFYSTLEKNSFANPSSVVGGFGARFGGTFVAGQSGFSQSNFLTNGGDLNTWPVITLTGPGVQGLDLVSDSGQVVWSIGTRNSLASGQVLVIDTRPWSRYARYSDGKPANGLISGSRIEDCSIPVGQFYLKYRGGGSAQVTWRDAYASL